MKNGVFRQDALSSDEHETLRAVVKTHMPTLQPEMTNNLHATKLIKNQNFPDQTLNPQKLQNAAQRGLFAHVSESRPGKRPGRAVTLGLQMAQRRYYL